MGRKGTIKVDYFGELLSVKEAAEKSKNSIETIRARIRQGLTGWDLFKPRLVKCDAQCVACQKPFPVGKGKPQKYCSRKCLHNSLRNNITSQCLRCGNDFKPRMDAGNGREQIYCSRKCAYIDRGKPLFTPLPDYTMVKPANICGHLVKARKPGTNYCSPKCTTKGAYWKRIKSQKNVTCNRCSIPFTPLRLDTIYCSLECSNRAGWAAYRKKHGSYSHRRRAKRFGVYYENVDVLSIFDRDGWTCQICGIITPEEYRGLSRDDSPEIDHIIPISKGGPHSPQNLQCACRRCNYEKGDTIDE